MPDHPLPEPRSLVAQEASHPRRWGRRLAALLVVGLLLAGGAALFAWPRPQATAVPAAPREPTPALTVALSAVQATSLARPVIGDGSVVAWQELVVGIETGGLRVAEVTVEEGDRVRAGQLLVRLDEAVPGAQAAQAEAAVAEAEAALRIAEADLQRSAQLARSDNVARQVLEQREAQARQAEARLRSARARNDEAKARLAQARILAPADGIVSRRAILPGAVTQPGQEALRLIRDGRLELAARVPELDLAAVRAGQAAQVRHGERTIAAEVRMVAPVVAADTRLGVVYLALPADSGLRPGMFAQAEITPAERPALTVPQEAVVVRAGRPAAFVLAPGADRVELRQLATGMRRDGSVEIRSGLAAGEQVVVAGAGFLSDGDRVRLAAPH